MNPLPETGRSRRVPSGGRKAALVAGVGAILLVAALLLRPAVNAPAPAGPPPAGAETPERPAPRAPVGSAARPAQDETPGGADAIARQLTREAQDAWAAGDVGSAMALLEEAVALAPDDPAPHRHYGRLLTLMVAYERAIPLLERARDLAPGDARAWLDLATVYERAQRFEDAWSARAAAEELVGAEAITRDAQGRFVLLGDAPQARSPRPGGGSRNAS